MRRARVDYQGQIQSATVDVGSDLLILADGSRVGFNDVIWLPPIEPRTTFALGLNYGDHAAELSFKAPEKPLVFLKSQAAFIGHKGTSVCPSDVHQMHFECELAVVIGREGRRIRQEHAYDFVAGYTVANDYALREYLENFYRPNLRVKNRDGCTPLGPWIVDAFDVVDPMALNLRSFVNGELVQQGNTRDMIYSIPAIIEYLSDFMTLSPGDMILTGTPKGVRFVKPGDIVVTEIDGIGRLVNAIAGEVELVSSAAERKTTCHIAS